MPNGHVLTRTGLAHTPAETRPSQTQMHSLNLTATSSALGKSSSGLVFQARTIPWHAFPLGKSIFGWVSASSFSKRLRPLLKDVVFTIMLFTAQIPILQLRIAGTSPGAGGWPWRQQTPQGYTCSSRTHSPGSHGLIPPVQTICSTLLHSSQTALSLNSSKMLSAIK